ncbi:MAG: signal peptidase I [Candidatus Aquicultorales bacterium]
MSNLESHAVGTMEKTEVNTSKKAVKIIREYVVLVMIALALSFGIRATVAEVRVVPTGSMIPTIQVGNRLLTLKVVYYYSDPKRGDIVVFSPPENLRAKFTEPFVKRVVGLPGDTVEVRDGRTFVNGREYYVPSADIPKYTYGPATVPAGHYFMLGDNRNQSYDSHEWGFVPRENVIAKALVVFWPLENAKVLR